MAEYDYVNVLYPGCDCNGYVADDGRGDCEKNWCYVDQEADCADIKESTYQPGWLWSKHACMGRQRPEGGRFIYRFFRNAY